MDKEFTKEQNILKASARDFLKKECPTEIMRDMRHNEKGYPDSLWNQMASLGWLGIVIPEQYDGLGGNFIDLAILLESMGEFCCPGPFFSTVVLGGQTIIKAGTEQQKMEILPKISSGEMILTLAVNEYESWWDFDSIAVSAKAEGKEFILNGSKLFVENAHIADYIICVARTGDKNELGKGLTLFLVDPQNPNIKSTKLETLSWDKQYEVIFDNVCVSADSIIGEVGEANDILNHLLDYAAVAKSAEMLGGIQKAFKMSVAYAKERKQFDKPIGSFQAIQHHCANMLIDVDGARFIIYQAARKLAAGEPAGMESAMAKAWVSDASYRVTRLGHQIHSAISFTDEHDMHLYYRNAKTGEIAFGNSDYHLERIAQHLGM